MVDGLAQAAVQEDFSQAQAPIQDLTQSQLVQVEQLDQLDKITVKMVEILCSPHLLRSVVVVAAPPLTMVHQVAAVVAAATITTVALVRQVKALLAETIQLDPVLEVVVLDQQVSRLQAAVVQILLAAIVVSVMAARLSLSSWTASNTAVAAVVVAQETQERTLQAVLDIQAAATVDVDSMTPRVSVPMRPTAKAVVVVAAAIITVAAHSPPAVQEAQAL